MRKQATLLAVSVLVVWLTTVPGMAQEKSARGEVKAIAEEAFIYGFPMVMNYGVVYESFIDKASSQYKCPFNQLYNTARVYTPKDTAVVTPNSDTPYSFFCADLRAEPVMFSIPEIEKGRGLRAAADGEQGQRSCSRSRRSRRTGTTPCNWLISTPSTTVTSAVARRATRQAAT